MRKIVVIEDDEDIRELVIYALEAAGFSCEGFEKGEDFLGPARAGGQKPSLVLLDIMLPDEDGLSILKRIRSDPFFSSTPVIMLTAKGSEADKVKGLNLGADDYIGKPFGVTEMIARVKAVLRRSDAEAGERGAVSYKDLSLDAKRRAVAVGLKSVELTFKEFELLEYLMRNAGIVLSRNKIMDFVWGYDYEGESRTVDMHIKTLRKKLGEAGEYIKTIRNVGYKLGE